MMCSGRKAELLTLLFDGPLRMLTPPPSLTPGVKTDEMVLEETTHLLLDI